MIRPPSPTTMVVGIKTGFMSNGNMVMKMIELNGLNRTWSLTVRGITVDLNTLGIENTFEATQGE